MIEKNKDIDHLDCYLRQNTKLHLNKIEKSKRDGRDKFCDLEWKLKLSF